MKQPQIQLNQLCLDYGLRWEGVGGFVISFLGVIKK
jgi:hypothetical protein